MLSFKNTTTVVVSRSSKCCTGKFPSTATKHIFRDELPRQQQQYYHHSSSRNNGSSIFFGHRCSRYYPEEGGGGCDNAIITMRRLTMMMGKSRQQQNNNHHNIINYNSCIMNYSSSSNTTYYNNSVISMTKKTACIYDTGTTMVPVVKSSSSPSSSTRIILKRCFWSSKNRRRRRLQQENREEAKKVAGRNRMDLRSRIERKMFEKEKMMGTTYGDKLSLFGGGGVEEHGTAALFLPSLKLNFYATTKNPYPLKPRTEFMRWIDPWYDLATLCSKNSQEDLLMDKVDSATRIYGVVSALMCSLSVALLAADFAANNTTAGTATTTSPSSSSCNNHCSRSSNNNGGKEEEIEDDDDNDDDEIRNNNDNKKNTGLCLHDHHLHRKSTFVEHVFSSMDNASGSSLLVSYGVSKQTLSDAYAGCCALSFYTSSTAMGLSGVLNAWLAATPPGGIALFTKQNSKFIALVPALLGSSKLFAGTALFLGLDRSKGVPVSYVGLIGIAVSTVVLSFAAYRGWNSTYRLIKKLAIKIEKKNIALQQQQQQQQSTVVASSSSSSSSSSAVSSAAAATASSKIQ